MEVATEAIRSQLYCDENSLK